VTLPSATVTMVAANVVPADPGRFCKNVKKWHLGSHHSKHHLACVVEPVAQWPRAIRHSGGTNNVDDDSALVVVAAKVTLHVADCDYDSQLADDSAFA
jgi:hypothetical protein